MSNVIYHDSAKPGVKCASCGRKADQEFTFHGPKASATVLNVCNGCGGLLGTMLTDTCEPENQQEGT